MLSGGRSRLQNRDMRDRNVYVHCGSTHSDVCNLQSVRTDATGRPKGTSSEAPGGNRGQNTVSPHVERHSLEGARLLTDRRVCGKRPGALQQLQRKCEQTRAGRGSGSHGAHGAHSGAHGGAHGGLRGLHGAHGLTVGLTAGLTGGSGARSAGAARRKQG